MIDEHCKDCSYYLKAKDGNIIYEICLFSVNSATEKCFFQAVKDLAITITEAFDKAFKKINGKE